MIKAFAKKFPAFYIDGASVDFGKYKCIGEGSICFVFKARLSGHNVAVKMLKSEDEICDTVVSLKQMAADFKEEINVVTKQLEHPHIEKFFGAGSMEYSGSTHPMIVYEYLGGGSVEDFYEIESDKLGKPFKAPRTLALSWCHQLLSALSFLHTFETPLAHRDIKPANCLITDDRKTLKLADFSLATPLKGQCADFSGAPSIAGSLRYMAPEVSESGDLDLEKADIYSAALTCWFIVFGKRPFDGYDPRTAQTMAMQGIRPSVKSSPELSKVLSPAWDYFASKRPSAARFAQQLAALRRQSVG